MKPQSKATRRSRAALIAISGVALAIGLTAITAQADEWNKKTILTINEPIQVTDTVLQPGQYVFKLLDSQSDRHIVEIYNADESHLIGTVMAIPNYRLQPTGKSRFLFWETPAGSTKALRAWFYPGDNFGQEFPYPKNLEQISTTQSASVTPAPAPTASAPPPAVASSQPPASTETEQQTEIAQNTPPPAPSVSQPEAAQEAPQQQAALSHRAELPKTASPYPMFGLAGLILLGLGGLLRQTRSA